MFVAGNQVGGWAGSWARRWPIRTPALLLLCSASAAWRLGPGRWPPPGQRPVCLIRVQGIPRWGPRLAGLHDAFCDAFKAASPDFQTEYGYPAAAPNSANLALCSKQVWHGDF